MGRDGVPFHLPHPPTPNLSPKQRSATSDLSPKRRSAPPDLVLSLSEDQVQGGLCSQSSCRRWDCSARFPAADAGLRGGGWQWAARGGAAGSGQEPHFSAASSCDMARLPQLALSVALGVLGLLGIILLAATSRDRAEPPTYKYGIVIDAGSSRTTLFIYKWPSGKENNTGIVSEHSSCQVKGPGISSYAENPAGAGESLKACLDKALRAVPSERHSQTPLLLGATAGMRLLNLSNPEATQDVLVAINNTLRSYHFSYRGARILSGDEEGLFGWVTANYLMENFLKYSWVGRWFKPARRTVGAMDLGGASTQITFIPEEVVREPERLVGLKLYGHEYTVYTHSYLCYGKDQVIKKVLAGLMQSQGSNSSAVSPCLPLGYNVTFSQNHVLGGPCTQDEELPDDSPGTTITFSGTSNPTRCQHAIIAIFNFASCDHSDCGFNNVYQPPVTGNFLAFSAFYHTVNFLETTLGRAVTSPAELKEAADTLCGMDFKTLKEKAATTPEKWLVDYCTMSYYVHTLLTQGYKFDNQMFKNIAFQKKVEGVSIGWALGYMLNLTNMIPPDDPDFRKVQLLGTWCVLIVIFILVIVAGVLVFVLFSRLVKNDSGIL
ncbi:ectonucleoside triphosphate diphosphohydrolase 2-like [Narcine bancroftii]|uniref:ectonucleoside triphosphate diphosphohydrolase 2-like n=1 Tax=Narcine bancroftii TaxID=1343680 RepID=UPI0038322CB7